MGNEAPNVVMAIIMHSFDMYILSSSGAGLEQRTISSFSEGELAVWWCAAPPVLLYLSRSGRSTKARGSQSLISDFQSGCQCHSSHVG